MMPLTPTGVDAKRHANVHQVNFFRQRQSYILVIKKTNNNRSLSSAEAEYIALPAFGKVLSCLISLVCEVANQIEWTDDVFIPAATVEVDSSAAIATCHQSCSTKLTKHISLRYHHVRNLVQRKIISPQLISTVNQIADGLTKPITRPVLKKH